MLRTIRKCSDLEKYLLSRNDALECKQQSDVWSFALDIWPAAISKLSSLAMYHYRFVAHYAKARWRHALANVDPLHVSQENLIYLLPASLDSTIYEVYPSLPCMQTTPPGRPTAGLHSAFSIIALLFFAHTRRVAHCTECWETKPLEYSMMKYISYIIIQRASWHSP